MTLCLCPQKQPTTASPGASDFEAHNRWRLQPVPSRVSSALASRYRSNAGGVSARDRHTSGSCIGWKRRHPQRIGSLVSPLLMSGVDVAAGTQALRYRNLLQLMKNAFRPRIFRTANLRLFALLALAAAPADAATIVQWTFEINTPANLPDSATIGPIAADVGSGEASGLHASATTDWTTPSGNGSSNSLSSNEWAVGDFYQFQLSSANFQDLTLTWDQTRSGTGPSTFDLAYSLNGTDFTIFSDNYDVPTLTWMSGSVNPSSTLTADLSSIAALNNQPTVFFRLIADSAPGGTAGTNRVDNFTVSAEPFAPPTEPLFWDANGAAAGAGGTGTWGNLTQTWSTEPGGGAGIQAFDPGKTAVFGSTAGTVTIDPEGVAANAGMRFDVTGYRLQGGTITLGGSFPRVAVSNAGDTAVIAAPIAGSAGLIKAGDGALELAASANLFTGNVTVAAGRLTISNDQQLGAAENDVAISGGTLRASATLALGEARDVSGNGAIEVPPGAVLTIAGTVNLGQTTIADAGTLRLTHATTPAALGAITFTSSGTLEVVGAPASAGNLSALGTAGTARILGPLDFGAQTRTAQVEDGTAAVDLEIAGSITLTGAAKLLKLGTGTLQLSGVNTSFSGLRHGTAGNVPVDGGTVRITNRDALGSGEYQFNAGILELASNLTGPDALPASVSLSIGASSQLPAVFTGGDLEITGPMSLFRATNGNYQHQLVVNNRLTLKGAFASSTGTGTSTGLTVGGTGTLVLDAAENLVSEPIVVESAALVVNGSLSSSSVDLTGDASLSGSGTLAGTLTVSSGRFSPGVGIGSMNVAGLTLDSDATFILELSTATAAFDLLNSTAAVTIGAGVATLQLNDLNSAPLSAGTEFRIIDNQSDQPTLGFFENLPDLAPIAHGQNTFVIDYGVGPDANDVVLRVVPEPSSAALILLGAALISGARRRP